MKKILIPIDFSQHSLNAFKYARGLAYTLGFSIQVVHIYPTSFDPRESIPLRPGFTREESILERMESFVKTVPKNEKGNQVLTQIKVEFEAIQAMVTTNKIVKLTEDQSIAMVVIGTKGAGNILNKMLGSISSVVAQSAHCPVILVPENVDYQDYKHVLYASNYESADEELIQQVIDFGNVFRATMHFVHVEDNDNYNTVEDTIFYKLFEKGDPAFSFNIVNIQNKPVMDGLNQYAKENDIDLMVLVNRQRSYFSNLFGLSLTNRMAARPSLPLMVFHPMNE